jgi:peptide/nickel transport system permease protein
MRRAIRAIPIGLLGVLVAALIVALAFSRYTYATQFRELPNGAPSWAHLLGTDGLGRDLFTRLIYGTAISLLLAPSAALVSTVIAAVMGSLAGWKGGWYEKSALALADLALALPLLFVLLALRALLPLSISPSVSAIATFALLGMLGWPSALRVVAASAHKLRNSEFLLLAEATGASGARIVLRHVVPNLRPVLIAQFWVAIPVFILTEATLSMLGLGVMEPLPSLGNLLRGLENVAAVAANPWRLTPLVVLIALVLCLQLALPAQEEAA